MRHELALLSRRLGGADLQATVHGYGVATDNLTVEALGERYGKRGFAATGRAQDDDQQRLCCSSTKLSTTPAERDRARRNGPSQRAEE